MPDTFDRLKAALADRYAIEREIGSGGMATVYLAEDLKHQRKVAVKVLRPELAVALGPERFLREIEIAARLRHPNILPLFDSGDADGFLYYVMPLVEGETLRDRLEREKQLTLEEALQITREVSDALSTAHSHGVVHRDIKPENILLDEGHAVIADFGIAKAASTASALTGTGMSVGTPSYMSPEQAAGTQEVDPRSDVYSLGCVLYEMLAGQPPFTGAPDAVIRQHIVATHTVITAMRPAVSAEISAALDRALAKIPADRYKTVQGFADALSPATGGTVSVLGLSRDRYRRRTLAIVAGIVVVAAGALWFDWLSPGSSGDRPRLVILPFENVGAVGDEYFAEGIAEEISALLTRVSGLNIVARQSAGHFVGVDDARTRLREEFDVNHVLQGTVRWQRRPDESSRVQVVLSLIRLDDESQVWGQVFTEEVSDIFDLQAQIAGEVVSALGVRLRFRERRELRDHRVVDLEAYNLYLQGRYHLHHENWSQAVSSFEQALALDSTFAGAHAGLADASVPPFVTFDRPASPANRARAETAARRAIALDPSLAEAHASLGFVLSYAHWEWEAAAAEFERAISIDSSYAVAHQLYANVLIARELPDSALASARRAQRLDPISPSITTDVGVVLQLQGRVEDATIEYKKALVLDPTFARARRNLSWARALQQEYGVAAAGLKQIGYPAEFVDPFMAAMVDPTLAPVVAEAFLQVEQQYAAQPYMLAVAYAVLQQDDKVIEWLGVMLDQRHINAAHMRIDPSWDRVRDREGFQRLLARVGL